MINYYVDPGSGFVFAQSTSLLWGMILGLLGAILFFFRFFFRCLKRFIWIFCILLALSILIFGGMMMHKPAINKKVIILGIDAMDPKITESLILKGKLPNLAHLKAGGTYSRLQTTVAAESVVAWTSFATGSDPGAHGIFDFIMRNPKDYLPYLSLNEVSNTMRGPKVQNRRRGRVFWEILSSEKVPCFVFFCPNTFPAEPLSGRMISGMGVPDLYGTMGRFTFYTSEPLTDKDKDTRGKVIHVVPKNNIIETGIYGPKIKTGSLVTESMIPLKVTLNREEKNALIEFQGNRFVLEEGSWSEWQRASFKTGLFTKAHGIVRLFLRKSTGAGDFKLYLGPVNFNPEKPLYPISYPKNYSANLAKEIGLYHTQGMPHDTWALTEDRLSESDFLSEADEVLNEKAKILKKELKNFKGGLFFFYFDTLDIIQHMFWRYLDPNHPMYEKGSLYQETIFKYYEAMDRIVGEVLKNIDKDSTLIILSDHGFDSFRRAVHLNRWLLDSGYLFLERGFNEGKEFFENVDWSKTKAYALGFGGIYLNKAGREYHGIVSGTEAPALKDAIIKGLKKFRDPEGGAIVIKNVYDRDKIYDPCLEEGWDLYVGFNAGYRASWQTALGGTSKPLIEDNKKKWSGDHLIDHNLVPGVLFINKRTELQNPSIIDIAPTILDLFGIAKPEEVSGKVLFKGALYPNDR